MKLIRFGQKGHEKPGILHKGKRLDCSKHFEDWNRDFFNGDGIEKLRQLINEQIDNLPEVGDNERWAACVARPGNIIGIGLNYSDHAIESGMAIPDQPILFMKASNTISGPYDDVAIPKGSEKTDWEVELAMVIKKDALYLNSEEEASEYVAGYCLFHDISERTFQLEMGGQWDKGKSCPGFSPTGPYLATSDEIENVTSLDMMLKVNEQVMQNGNTSTMIFKSNYLVYYLSQFMLLEAGDIITTGTPPGVGLGMKPPQYLSSGDVVELSMDGLGSQKQHFI